VPALLRTASELSAMMRKAPFTLKKGEPPLLVGFVRTPFTAAQKKALLALQGPVDEFKAMSREVWWHSQWRQTEHTLSYVAIGKACGFSSTIRNVNTVRTMAERWGA
jgi:uncharacterized protein (DUF1697 family)